MANNMEIIEIDKTKKKDVSVDWANVTNYKQMLSIFGEDGLKMLPFDGYCSHIEHPSRLIMIDGVYSPVDEPMADLIEEMNCRGFDTLACCCGHASNDSYYIMLDVNEKNKNLIDKLNRFCLVDPYSEDAIRCAGCGCNYTDELERVFIPTDQIKSSVKRYEYSTAYGHLCFYFYWKTEDDIKFINDIILKMMDEVEKVTVADLIKELQKLPQDAEVLHTNACDDVSYPVNVEYNEYTNKVYL